MIGALKRTLVPAACATLIVMPAQAQATPDLAGGRYGVVESPEGEFTPALHVPLGGGEALVARIENLSQRSGEATDITDIPLSGDHLAFRIAPIGAVYTGSWDGTAEQWRGTITQGQTKPLNLTRDVPTPPAVSGPAPEIAGDWLGTIEVEPGTRLPLVVHIERNDAGGLVGTMDSPTQGVSGLSLSRIASEGEELAFTVPAIGGEFQGRWDAPSGSWIGEWSQAGMRRALSFAPLPAPPTLPADWRTPSDDEIRRMILNRNAPRPGQGIVVGVLGPDGPRIVSGGSGPAANVDGRTLFEIGSISKVFTALILADMVNKGEVSLDDPAAQYLPPGRRMPERGGRPITLRDLATHRSGLPRMADDMRPISDPDGPFADYCEERLLEFLERYQLPRDPGSQWEYSNLGAGLLGYLLGRAAGSDYETLLRERITGPLGMHDTLITLTPRHSVRLAAPFDAYMRSTRMWDLAIVAGAGGIRSTASDMLIFARALLNPESPIAPASKTALAVRTPATGPGVEQALGWQVLHLASRELLVHDGETGGFRAILILDPTAARAVVALANSAAAPTPADIALHILIGSPVAPTPPVPPAPPPPTVRAEISLSAAELDRIVGRYDFGDGFVLAVTRDGDALYAHREDVTSALQIFPESPFQFFWKAVDAQIRFTTDVRGAVTGAELTQGVQSFTGRRLDP